MKEDSFAKYSAASKARWASRTPEKRSEMKRDIAIAKWAKTTPEQRKAHSLLMVKARKSNGKD